MSVHGSVNLGNDPSKQRNCKQFEVLIVFYPVDLMESALSPFFLFVHETQSDYVQGEHSIVHTQGRALKAMTSTAVSHRHCTVCHCWMWSKPLHTCMRNGVHIADLAH